MYAYLWLSAQPMQIRFIFRKARTKRDPKKETEKDGRLYAILTINKIRYERFKTPIECSQSAWDNRRSRRPSQEVISLNGKIQAYQLVLESAHQRLLLEAEQRGRTIVLTADLIRKALEPKPLTTLAQIYPQFMASKKLMIEPDRTRRSPEQISQSTYDTYPKRWVLIEAYLNHAQLRDMPVDDIGHDMAGSLKEYLLGQKQTNGEPYALATINKVISLTKMLLTYAVSKRHMKVNPLSDYSCRGGSAANPKPLTERQLQHLETCPLPPALRHQCDSWLVAGELCLHYSDFMRLPLMKIILTGSGQQIIQHDRSKQSGTSLLQTVNLTDRAIRLINKYGGVAGLYYCSSTYYSKLLKRIAKLADLRDENGALIDLQFGQGRDSGLTARAIQGANSIQLAKMGGWSRPTYAERYIGNAAEIVATFADRVKSKTSDT